MSIKIPKWEAQVLDNFLEKDTWEYPEAVSLSIQNLGTRWKHEEFENREDGRKIISAYLNPLTREFVEVVENEDN